MPRFFRRIAEGVFDQADLARRTLEQPLILVTARDLRKDLVGVGADPSTVKVFGFE